MIIKFIIFTYLFFLIFYLGADIKEMKNNTFAYNIRNKFLNNWNISEISKPVIAAVNGYAVS